MALAQIGPLTTLLESVATAVGAGVVLCSVMAGIVGLARGWSRRDVEGAAATAGYFGGGVGAVCALADVILRYGVWK